MNSDPTPRAKNEERKPYRKPKLVVHGTLAQLTRSFPKDSDLLSWSVHDDEYNNNRS